MTDPVIQVCYPLDEAPLSGPFGRDSLLSDLEKRGLRLVRVEHPGPEGVVLLFSSLEGPEVASLDASVRRRTVLVAEGLTPKPEEAESARGTAGLLGLVEPEAWSTSHSGLLVAWGLYGRPDIAKAAELASLGSQGLQPIGTRAPLVDVLARFLAAAELLANSLNGTDVIR